MPVVKYAIRASASLAPRAHKERTHVMTTAPPQEAQKKAIIAFYLFAGAAVISFLYCILLDQYNGDFYPRYIYAPVYMLLPVLVVTVLPYFIAWNMSSFVEKLPSIPPVRTTTTVLLTVMALVFAWNIFATLMYGVAVADAEVYSATGIVGILIQLGNRVNPTYIGAFFILAAPKKWRFDILAAALMIGTGLLRAGLGGFVYVFVALSIKYRNEILLFASRHKTISVLIIAALPIAISMLYNVRAELRGDEIQDLSVVELLFGRFFGRLTSFSNILYIVQESSIFQWASQTMSPLYYVKQAAAAVLGSSVAPVVTPERLLIEGGGYYDGNSTYMAGIAGNLLMAWFISPWVAALNLALMLGTTFVVLFVSRAFANGEASAFGIGMLLYPLTSGVADEFAYLLLNTVILFAIVVVFRIRTVPGGRA